MRKMAILGSTGSIGTQTLDLCSRYPQEFAPVALVARSSGEKLIQQVRRFRPRLAGLTEPPKDFVVPEDLRFCEWVFGPEALLTAAACDCDDVMVAVVGMVGLQAVLQALSAHKRVLLANKEALVAGGGLVMAAAAREGENCLLPVDSEHSAIFQCLQGAGGNPIASIALTCSGGPLRTRSREEVRRATVKEVLCHPTWSMGRKITADCATLFNKGLEMMEAGWLFGVKESQIQVLIHPQSIVHSGISFEDGALLCQMGTADMRLPILYAMMYPRRRSCPSAPLDLCALQKLEFFSPDDEKFPSLRLSRECMRAGGAAGCIYNAANEEAIGELLRNPAVNVGMVFDTVEAVLNRLGSQKADTLEAVLAADSAARNAARAYLRLRLAGQA